MCGAHSASTVDGGSWRQFECGEDHLCLLHLRGLEAVSQGLGADGRWCHLNVLMAVLTEDGQEDGRWSAHLEVKGPSSLDLGCWDHLGGQQC